VSSSLYHVDRLVFRTNQATARDQIILIPGRGIGVGQWAVSGQRQAGDAGFGSAFDTWTALVRHPFTNHRWDVLTGGKEVSTVRTLTESNGPERREEAPMATCLQRFDAIAEARRWPLVRLDLQRTLAFFAERRRDRPILAMPEVTLAVRFDGCMQILNRFDLFIVAVYKQQQGRCIS
jgi:hypothetical protein